MFKNIASSYDQMLRENRRWMFRFHIKIDIGIWYGLTLGLRWPRLNRINTLPPNIVKKSLNLFLAMFNTMKNLLIGSKGLKQMKWWMGLVQRLCYVHGQLSFSGKSWFQYKLLSLTIRSIWKPETWFWNLWPSECHGYLLNKLLYLRVREGKWPIKVFWCLAIADSWLFHEIIYKILLARSQIINQLNIYRFHEYFR